MKKIIFILTLLLTLTACSSERDLEIVSTNLMEDVKESSISPVNIEDQENGGLDKTVGITDFSFDILKKAYKGENTLISPLSIISALSMTANGAENETLSQMEEVFAADRDSLNEYLYSYKSYLPSGDKYKVSLANSIWFKDEDGLTIEEDFLQTNKDFYDGDAYKAPFDESTKDDINIWVNEKTDGMIEELLEEKPPEDAIMYLINALSFDAEWEDIYSEHDIRKAEFTTKNDEIKTVDFMYSEEYGYIEIAKAIGFSKAYADNKYSFVALLPDEGVEISDFISSINGKTIIDAIKNQSDEEVVTSMPKFEFEYSNELSKILQELGMIDAFDPMTADFSSLGHSSKGNILIDRVLHKTKIQVDEKGTKAGAVTAVEMVAESADIIDPKTVNLDRPFFFAIVDNEFSMPIFMGVLEDPTEQN